MAAIREESLNSYLALLLDDYQQISAVAELRSGAQAIDITVTHEGSTASLRILIEAKIGTTSHKRRAAASQARSRLSGTPDALAFALCYPSHLKVASLSAKEREQALRDSKIWFAPVQRYGRNPTWREGSIDDLADTLRNADLSRQRVADSIEHTVREVAAMLLAANCALDIADALVLPKEVEDREAATLIAALILSNAALLHHRLRLVPALDHIAPLETVFSKADDAPRVLRDEWNKIREVDYYPVFFPGLAVLNAVPDEDLREPIRWVGENAVAVADELASLRFDHAGPLYHRLLPSSRFDGSFYTNNVSALLLARLALTEDFAAWEDSDSLAALRIMDPACGTGTLLMAAMHTIRDRHERAAGDAADSEPLHLVLVEDILYGLDINRHGVQLAACNLTLANPRIDYRRMHLYTMKHGPQPNGSTKAGSLEFVATAKGKQDIASLAAPLPTTGDMDAERAEPGAAPTKSITGIFDLVIMNPPFTRNDIRNRQYDKAARRALQEREVEIAKYLKLRDPLAFEAIDQTSIESFFAPLADTFLKHDQATLAMVLPTTALTGSSSQPKRCFLAGRFQIEAVVTTHDPSRINFSDKTEIHESLLLARRPGPERLPTRFISLARMPRDAHEAILLSDLINRGELLGRWGTEHSWPWPRIREGDWSAAQFYSSLLAEAGRDLAALAASLLGPAGQFCHIEPEGRRIRDAFLPLAPRNGPFVPGRHSPRLPAVAPPDTPWTQRILWDHPTDICTTMTAEADVLGIPKPAKERYARRKLLGRASPLLVASRLYTHQVRVAACHSPVPLLGSAWIPVTPKTPSEDYEKALCAWWNSTPGILTLLQARARKLTYPRYALDSLRSLLVPDPDVSDIRPLVEAFAKCKGTDLQPWPRMHECPARALLDEAAARVLRISGRTIADWRERIAREPTVSGKPVGETV